MLFHKGEAVLNIAKTSHAKRRLQMGWCLSVFKIPDIKCIAIANEAKQN